MIKRKAGRRRWSLVVQSFRKPELRVSQGAQLSELLRFLSQNEAWLKRALQKKNSQPALKPLFEEGESLPLLGTPKPWTWQWTPLKKSFLVARDDRTEIYCPQIFGMSARGSHPI
ncbi:MAG: YgjP-like metallopeptidase domain-containing protein [Bdellovibrio sp.]